MAAPGKAVTNDLSPFSALICTLFRACGLVMGTGDENRPEALLAGMDATLAELIVPTAAILPQENGPLQPPLLAPVNCLNVLYASASKAAARNEERPIVCSRIIMHIQKNALFSRRGPCFRAPTDDARRCLETRMERFGPSWPQGKTLFSLFAGFLPGMRCLVRREGALPPL